MSNKKQAKVVMYASDFTGYGKIQAMKSTLEFLARDAGFNFFFVNEPHRESTVKVNYCGKVHHVGEPQSPAEINRILEGLQDQHAI